MDNMTKVHHRDMPKDYFALPTCDVVFKKLFADKENIDLLKDFLATFLNFTEQQMENIVVRSPELPPNEISKKFVHLDLRIELPKDEINIEMQVFNQSDYSERTLYYWAQMLTAEVQKGETYGAIKRTICLNVLDYNMPNNDSKDFYSEVGLLYLNNYKPFSDKMKLAFLELPKANINNRGNLNADPKLAWAAVLKSKNEEDLTMLQNAQNPAIQKAGMFIHNFNKEENEKYLAFVKDRARRDEISALAYAKDEGRQDGEKKGRQDNQREIARRMAFEGFNNEQIKRLTGIDAVYVTNNDMQKERYEVLNHLPLQPAEHYKQVSKAATNVKVENQNVENENADENENDLEI